MTDHSNFNFFDTRTLPHDQWIDVSDQKLYAVVDQEGRGPFIQVPTNGMFTRGLFLFPDKHAREVKVGQLVRITKVLLKMNYGFFRSVPCDNPAEADANCFLSMIRSNAAEEIADVCAWQKLKESVNRTNESGGDDNADQ